MAAGGLAYGCGTKQPLNHDSQPQPAPPAHLDQEAQQQAQPIVLAARQNDEKGIPERLPLHGSERGVGGQGQVNGSCGCTMVLQLGAVLRQLMQGSTLDRVA